MTPVDPRVDPELVPEGSAPCVIAETQKDKYIPLPSIVTPTHHVITRWTLTDEERQALICGEDLYLTIHGTPIRPVRLSVGPLDWRALCQPR